MQITYYQSRYDADYLVFVETNEEDFVLTMCFYLKSKFSESYKGHLFSLPSNFFNEISKAKFDELLFKADFPSYKQLQLAA